MLRISDASRSVVVIVLLGGALFTVVSAGVGDGGSKCPDASCTGAPPGAQCEPKYGERDECCPVWHCNNGQTAYGMTRGSSSSFSSFSSSSSGGSFGGGGMGMNMNPFGGGGGGNPLAGMLGGLFGGFGGRR